MGCDIHIHLEANFNGRWEHVTILDGERNYELFGFIAGVRIAPDGFIEPRGLPFDLSQITALSYSSWEPDAHTMGWLSASEMVNAVDRYATHYGNSYDDPTEERVKRITSKRYQCGDYSNHYIDEVTSDQRYVFWFDN